MKQLIAIFLTLSVFYCDGESKKSTSMATYDLTSNPIPEAQVGPVRNSEPYSIDLQIDTINSQLFNLKIFIKLNDGAHYVSPHSSIAYTGRFTMTIMDHDDLQMVGALNETPRSVEEYDSHPFINGPVNWVRVNTVYTQLISIKNKKDFEVIGDLQFTIEPRCTLEKIPFIIKYEEGEMKFELFQC